MATDTTVKVQETRVAALRQRCLARKGENLFRGGDPRLIAASLRASEEIPSWSIRRGMLTRDLLAGLPLAIDDRELLVGRMALDREEWRVGREQAEAFLAASHPNLRTPGQTGRDRSNFGSGHR